MHFKPHFHVRYRNRNSELDYVKRRLLESAHSVVLYRNHTHKNLHHSKPGQIRVLRAYRPMYRINGTVCLLPAIISNVFHAQSMSSIASALRLHPLQPPLEANQSRHRWPNACLRLGDQSHQVEISSSQEPMRARPTMTVRGEVSLCFILPNSLKAIVLSPPRLLPAVLGVPSVIHGVLTLSTLNKPLHWSPRTTLSKTNSVLESTRSPNCSNIRRSYSLLVVAASATNATVTTVETVVSSICMQRRQCLLTDRVAFAAHLRSFPYEATKGRRKV